MPTKPMTAVSTPEFSSTARRSTRSLPWWQLLVVALTTLLTQAMHAQTPAPGSSPSAPAKPAAEPSAKAGATELATFGGGCFWCTEAVFQRIDGVKAVASGYAGGKTDNPTYKEVTSGKTGHAEVLQVEYDPKKITFERLLEVFWVAHDPTTLNRQGNDVGTQYRSIILYHGPSQKEAAEKSRKAAQKDFTDPIVTEIVPLTKFYKAEDYHQNYFNNNPNQPYCAYVIRPKLKKVLEKLSKH